MLLVNNGDVRQQGMNVCAQRLSSSFVESRFRTGCSQTCAIGKVQCLHVEFFEHAETPALIVNVNHVKTTAFSF